MLLRFSLIRDVFILHDLQGTFKPKCYENVKRQSILNLNHLSSFSTMGREFQYLVISRETKRETPTLLAFKAGPELSNTRGHLICQGFG